MAEKNFQPGECYTYPLIIKKLLNDALIKSPDREIVYGDAHRYTYRDLNQRIAKLASGLTGLGASAGGARLPKYGVPDRYVFTDAIPKTSVGKLDKKVLRKQHI